jgi:hypothetical protein
MLFLWLQKYHDLDVEVIRKDGLILIREMAAEVKNMMDIKMNAVMVSLFHQFFIRYFMSVILLLTFYEFYTGWWTTCVVLSSYNLPFSISCSLSPFFSTFSSTCFVPQVSLALDFHYSAFSVFLFHAGFFARLILRPWRWRRYVPPKLIEFQRTTRRYIPEDSILFDNIFNVSLYSQTGGKFKHLSTEIFFRKVAYAEYDVPWFAGQVDFNWTNFMQLTPSWEAANYAAT